MTNNKKAKAGKTTQLSHQNNHIGFEFEIFGNVQGVFFRKNTQRKAHELGLVGWVANTSRCTVIGKCFIPHHSTLLYSSSHSPHNSDHHNNGINHDYTTFKDCTTAYNHNYHHDVNVLHEMKLWLMNEGSPKCRIDRACFNDIAEVEEGGGVGKDERLQLFDFQVLRGDIDY